MTATTSTAKKSFFAVHFRNKLIENKKFLIIDSVIHLLGLPLLSIIGLIAFHYNNKELYEELSELHLETFMVVSIIALIIALFTGIVIATFSFNYLYRKSNVDMAYSLPLTTKQRFLADFFSGLSIYVVPAILAVILSLAILGIGSAFVDMPRFWAVFPELFRLGIIVFIGMIMLYTFTVLTTVFCGNMFETAISIFTANLTIPATVCAVFFIISNHADGTIPNDSLLANTFLTSTSPAGIVSAFAYSADIMGSSTDQLINYFNHWIIPTIIVIALYFAAAFLLYNRRKAEDVSKPYVYKVFYYIIAFLIMFCIFSLFTIDTTGSIAGVITCAIFYFIFEVITKRGFKEFWTTIVSFAIFITAIVSFDKICESTEGFGRKTYIPRESAVSSITFYGSEVIYNGAHDIVFTDKDVIRETVRLHEQAVRYLDDNESDMPINEYYQFLDAPESLNLNHSSDITIIYNMNNGSTVSREYWLPDDMCGSLYTAIALSDESAEKKSNLMALYCFNYDSSQWYDDLKDVPKDITSILNVSNKFNSAHKNVRLTYDDVIDLKNAYKTDLLAMTEEEYLNAPVYAYISGYRDYDVRESFVNTIELLEKYGCGDFGTCQEQLEEITDNRSFGLNIFTDIRSLYLKRDDSGEARYVKAFDTYTFLKKDYYYDFNVVPVGADEINDEFAELLDKCTPVIVNGKAAGVIAISNHQGNSLYFLPDTEENRKLIEEAREKYIEGKQFISQYELNESINNHIDEYSSSYYSGDITYSYDEIIYD